MAIQWSAKADKGKVLTPEILRSFGEQKPKSANWIIMSRAWRDRYIKWLNDHGYIKGGKKNDTRRTKQ